MIDVPVFLFRNRRLTIAAGLLLAAVGLGIALSRAGMAQERNALLTVPLVSPRGEIERLHSIDIVFSETMVPLGDRRRVKKDVPLEIDPPIEGSFSWIGSRVLTFVPRPEVPPGTRLTCTIPAGTRSLEGAATPSDHVWEIIVGRPRLLRTVPREGGSIAPDADFYLVFSLPPGAGAEDAVSLIGPSGRIALERFLPDSAAAAALKPRTWKTIRPEEILALRPVERLADNESYRLEIDPGLPFVSSNVGLAAAKAISFHTYGSPRLRSASADRRGIEIVLQGPVDPDTLRAYLETVPEIPDLSIEARSGTSLRLTGRIRLGSAYEIRLHSGLPSLLGTRLIAEQRMVVWTPHLPPELSISPRSGYFPRVPGLTVRLQAANLDSVEVFATWVEGDSIPSRLQERGWERPAMVGSRIAVWHETRLGPDSLHVIDIPLARFGPRPPGSQALQIFATGRRLFPDPDQPDRLTATALLQITDLGLSSFTGEERGIAWVTRLSTGQPVEGAEVRLRKLEETAPLWIGRTDRDGIVWTPGFASLANDRRTTLFAEVRAGDDGAWLQLNRWRSLGSRRAGSRGGSRPRAFIATDRPLYRPGETVHWVLFARRTGRDGIAAADLGGVGYLVRAGRSGKELDRGRIELTPPGNGSGSFRLPDNLAPGTYQIALTQAADGSGEPFARVSFSVEEFRLPRFEADLSAPSTPVISGSTIEIEGRFGYLGGGPLSRTMVRWTLQRRPDWSVPQDYADFSFRDDRVTDAGMQREGGPTIRIASGEGKLDRDGRIQLPVTPSLDGLGQDQVYLLEMGARDLADRSAYDVVSFRVQRAEVRAGARARNLLATKERAVEFSAVVLDTSGAPAAGIPLRWTIERRDWKTVRIRRIGGVFGYENVPRDTVLHAGSGVSTTEPLSFRWIPPTPGRYSFLVEATDVAGRRTSARDLVWVSGSTASSWRRDDSGWLELKPDRDSYEPGDTALVLLPAPAIETEGLLLVLDDGIRSVRRLRGVQGSPRLPIPLAGAYPPGLWVQTILVGPSSVPQGESLLRRLPYRGWGRVPITVRDDRWRLQVAVSTEREVYEPGEEVLVEIALRDAEGRPVEGTVTIAVVDDAIFELLGASAPDPLARLLPPRGPGIDHADIRQTLRLPASLEKGDLSPGGGGEGAGPGLRRRFLPTVHWEALVPVGADGRARLSFRLADDLTRYRVRILASSGTNRFGYGESKLDVRKPLQIEWGAPRFAREGDAIEIVAIVRSHLEKKAKVEVEIEAKGARIKGRTKRKVKIEPEDHRRVVFRLTDPQRQGITLRLRARSGERTDAAEIVIPVERPILWDRSFHGGRAKPLARTTIQPSIDALRAMGGLTTVVSPSMLSGFEDALEYVIDYPYGCLEQLSSTLLGLACRERIARHLGEVEGEAAAARSEKVASAISQIERCAARWTIHAWPSQGSSAASDYTVGYALYALTRASQAGFAIPEGLRERFAEETARRLRRLWDDSDQETGMRRLLSEGPWLLLALSEAERGRPAEASRIRTDDVETLVSRRDRAPLESRLALGLTLANIRTRPDASHVRETWPSLSSALLQEIKERQVQRTGRFAWVAGSEETWGDGIGGGVRATALFLRFLAKVDPADADLPGLVGWLLSERRRGTGAWRNNHETALTLDLLVSTLIEVEGPPSQVSGTVSVGGDFESFQFSGRRGGVFRRFTPIAEMTSPNGTPVTTQLRVETDGRRPVYFSATLDEAYPALEAAAREEGLILERSYVDRNGRPLEGEIPLGEPLFVHLAIVVSRDAKTLVVDDPLPAGIEVLNLRFENAPRITMSQEPRRDDGTSGTSLRIAYRELRDRSVRLFAEEVRAGLYHIYYPAIATTAGTYRTPGARAELMYSPEVYATSSPAEIRIKAAR